MAIKMNEMHAQTVKPNVANKNSGDLFFIVKYFCIFTDHLNAFIPTIYAIEGISRGNVVARC